MEALTEATNCVFKQIKDQRDINNSEFINSFYTMLTNLESNNREIVEAVSANIDLLLYITQSQPETRLYNSKILFRIMHNFINKRKTLHNEHIENALQDIVINFMKTIRKDPYSIDLSSNRLGSLTEEQQRILAGRIGGFGPKQPAKPIKIYKTNIGELIRLAERILEGEQYRQVLEQIRQQEIEEKNEIMETKRKTNSIGKHITKGKMKEMYKIFSGEIAFSVEKTENISEQIGESKLKESIRRKRSRSVFGIAGRSIAQSRW